MSTTDPQPAQISKVVFTIVSRGRKNNSLRSVSLFYIIPARCDSVHSSLTPRLVRHEVEKELGLSKNTLDVPKLRDVVKRAIQDAMVCVFLRRSATTMC